MTPALLRDIGEALFGPRWRSGLAEALGVNERTMRRWAAGQFAMPAGLPERLLGLLEDRRDRIAGLLKRL